MSRLSPAQINALHQLEVYGSLYDDKLNNATRAPLLALERKGMVELVTDEDMDLCWVRSGDSGEF